MMLKRSDMGLPKDCALPESRATIETSHREQLPCHEPLGDRMAQNPNMWGLTRSCGSG